MAGVGCLHMNIPDYPHERTPGFNAGTVDRKAEWRTDPAAREALLDQAVLVPVCRYRMPMSGDSLETLPALAFKERLDSAIWLGLWNQRSVYTLEVSDDEAASWPDLHFTDLRGAAMRLQPDDAAIMAYARAMVFWAKRHRYCGRCGEPTRASHAGHVLRCDACDLEHYPRSDPSMLVQVSDDRDRCLLGRQAGWPPAMWSVLAGFVEPGESIEDTVIREVWEEARIKVSGMRYFASQPWPFPASVLVGFHAVAEPDQPQVEQDELEAADWFSREQVCEALLNKQLFLPPPFTLSFRLIESWYDLKAEAPLASVLARR